MPRLLPLAVMLLSATPVLAQAERYELGRRLKAFEAQWEKTESDESRQRALAELPKLTMQFLSGRLGEAGRTLDLAAFALTTDVSPSTARQWLWSLSAIPEARIVDGSVKELAVTIQPFYPMKGDPPSGLELQLWFTNKDVVKVSPRKFPITVKVPLPPLGDFRGLDRKLYFLADGAKELRPTAIGISQIAHLEMRLDKLRKATVGTGADTIEWATARARARRIAHAAAKTDATVASTDLPYADLLANAETMLDGKPFFTVAKHGQFWLTVPVGEKNAIDCRVFIPKGLDKAKPVPVVFAVHGAGGDENLFCEGYGAGRIVKECEKRGWVLVCPRASLFDPAGPPVAELVAKLTERYPLDPKRVFVIGHSLGAMHAIGLAQTGTFAAIAVLGGGGNVTKPAAFATLPVFVGVGAKDSLALTAARSLKKILTDSGAKAVTYREYPDVEHLVIVREALPEVFALFDTIAAK